MKVIIVKDYDEMSRKAFEVIKEMVVNKPDCSIGLTTGSSTEGMYKYLVKDHNENGTSFENVKTYNTDEYIGIDFEDSQSYHYFMENKFYSLVNLNRENTYMPNNKGDLKALCDEYNAVLDKTTIDIQVLGIGANGHIGFNEPGTPFDLRTNVVDLDASTIAANARFFDGDLSKVPTQAITMGIKDLMASKQVLLLASGKGKAKAIQMSLEGEVTTDVPGSVLQNHDNVTFIIDEDAASLLRQQ